MPLLDKLQKELLFFFKIDLKSKETISMSMLSIFMEFILIINMLLAFVITFLERRKASSTWAWLMVLVYLPIVGFPLYIIMGQNMSKRKIFKWDKQTHDFIKKIVAAQKQDLRKLPYPGNPPLLEEYKELIYMNLNIGEATYSKNNGVKIFTNGTDKFTSLFADIHSAKEHIHLVYYIIRDDALGNRLADALVERAQAGVSVRFLYDDGGSRRLSRKYLNRLRQAGVQVEAFFPGKLPLINWRMNYRNHRKLVIIDGKVGYIGGFNIGEEYVGLNPKFGFWRDTHLRIAGDAVKDIQLRFMLDWNQASKHKMDLSGPYYHFDLLKQGDVGLQIVSSGPDNEWEQIKQGYIKMISSAKNYIFVQTPYFIPDDSVLDVLKVAAVSGVDVRIMIPNKPDHPFVYWATYSYIGEMLKAGARIYTYENGFLHAKTIIVDDKIASVGTANIDVRSFRLNFEVNAFIYHVDTAEELARIFLDDISHSTELTWELYQQRSLWIKFKESISRLLSPVL